MKRARAFSDDWLFEKERVIKTPLVNDYAFSTEPSRDPKLHESTASVFMVLEGK